MVWIWDDAVRSIKAESLAEEKLTVIPETLFVLPPKENTLRLVACMEGVEIQVWQAGFLKGSRWFKVLPGHLVLQQFFISNDLDPATPIPEPFKTPWSAKPWAKSSDHTLLTTLKNETLLVHCLVAMLIMGGGWNTAVFLRYHRSNAVLDQSIERLSTEIEPILTARGEALEARRKFVKIQEVLLAPSQIHLMAVVADVLPLKKVALTEWHYTPSIVTIVLEGEEHNPLLYVERLQAVPLFGNVKVNQGRDRRILEISMEIVEDSLE